MLLPLLKERTATAHARIEEAVPLQREDLTADGYARHLARLYGFYAPLEPQLLPHFATLGFNRDRLKRPLLEEDLRALGLDDEGLRALPHCTALPRVDTLPRAVGCLYVLEGSTLGGQLLTRQLTARLPSGTPLRFLNPYGADTGRHWRSFREAAEHAVPAHAHEDAVSAAQETFAQLHAWLTRADHGAPP